MSSEPVERARSLGALVAAILLLVCLWMAGEPPVPDDGRIGPTVAKTDDIRPPDHGRISWLDEWMGAFRELGERAPPSDATGDRPADGAGSEDQFPLPSPREFEGYVLIDPGHGGRDGGAVGNGMIEKNVTLELSKMLHGELERRGIPSRLTRDKDVGLSLMERCAMANRGGDALMVSVHVNSIAGPGASGIETFYNHPRSTLVEAMNRMRHPVLRQEFVEDRRSRLLAQIVQRKMVAQTGARDRGIKNQPLAVIRHTEAPAILVECGFLSDADEAAKLATRSYRRKLVIGMADGIESFLKAVKEDPAYGFIENRPEEPSIESANGSGVAGEADSPPTG